MQNLIALSKITLHYTIQFLAITGIQFVIFFLFAKYKSRLSFIEVFKVYLHLFVKALLVTVTLLSMIVILTKYVTMCSMAVLLLAISSVSILFKHLNMFDEHKAIVFDMLILLANGYAMYSLITHDFVSVTHYLVLYAIVLYVFLHERLRAFYKVTLAKQ